MTEPAIPLRHVAASAPDCPLTLREAVAEAVVKRTHDRITGFGEFGDLVQNGDPSKVLTAGFLLPSELRQPAMTANGLSSDATSPINVSVLGMSFQTDHASGGSIQVKPSGSIYVRKLPTVENMKRWGVTFGLRKEIALELKAEKRERLTEARRAAGLPERGRVPEGKREALAALRVKSAQEARAAVFEKLKIDRFTTSENFEPMYAGEAAFELVEAQRAPDPDGKALDGDGPSADVSSEEVARSEGDLIELQDAETFRWRVVPGQSAEMRPSDDLVDPVDVPLEWRRLELDLPSLAFDPRWTPERLQQEADAQERLMALAIEERLVAWEADVGPTGGRDWAVPLAVAGGQKHKVRPSQVAAWDRTLDTYRKDPARSHPRPEIRLRLEIRITRDPVRPMQDTVRIVLANRSVVPDRRTPKGRQQEHALFLAGIEVALPADLHREHTLERIEPSYRWSKWLHHPALGINCGVERRSEAKDGDIRLSTTFLPVWRQPRIQPYRIEPSPRFETLMGEDGGLGVIEALVDQYREWLRERDEERPWQRDAANLEPGQLRREEDRYGADRQAWERELDRIETGLRILRMSRVAWDEGRKESPEAAPFRAWRATNGTFAEVANRFPGPDAALEWRLFQLAFLVAHLPGAVSRIPEWAARRDVFPEGWMEEDDDTASLLYFPTGGGKSEAFFALLVLQLFVDRLRGKKRGVTGIVRYPLRLLTAQQASRFARTLAMAELIRRKMRLAGDPFQIGFWVGSGNTPNGPAADGFQDVAEWGRLTVADETDLLARSREYEAAQRWRRLSECPFCGGKHVGLRRRHEGVKTQRLAHVCLSPSCAWNAAHGGVEPLPFHAMDSDIYAYAPGILLGTVDKMAMIAHSPATIAKVFGMFGFAPWMFEERDANGNRKPGFGRLYCPPARIASSGPTASGCVEIGPVYWNRRIELFDPFPAIEVQDEAHLLEQSLGTFAGLFETMFETVLRELAPAAGAALTSRIGAKPRRLKIVAASATVQGPERQVQMLYQRRVAMFPHPGPDLYESFFARLERPADADIGRESLDDEELRSPTRRLYVSMPTNGKPHTSATVSVLSAAHLTLSELMNGLASEDRTARVAVREALRRSLFDDELRPCHLRALEVASDDGLAEAVDLMRVALTYVTNKKGGDSVVAAINEFVPRDHLAAGIRLGNVNGVRTGLITGAIEMERIQHVVDEAAPRWKVGDPVDVDRDFFDAIRGIVATSAISHGVDIGRLNLMFFAGLPSDIAEYVQASSRIGRTHVGVSVLVPTPQRPRDIHVAEIHDVFHRFLERMVQPAAVDRWGEQAIQRVLASSLQAMFCAVGHYKRLARDPKGANFDSDGIPSIADALENRMVDFSKEVSRFVAASIGLGTEGIQRLYQPGNAGWYGDLLQGRVNDALRYMIRPLYMRSTFRSFFENTKMPLPMTSLRDVDEGGRITASDRATHQNNARVSKERLVRLMRILRKGSAAWGEGEGVGDEDEMESV